MFDRNQFLDDKIQIVWALLLIALFAMFTMASPENLVNNIVSGMLGMAIGKAVK